MTDTLRGLADQLHTLVLRAHPFLATALGLPGYDAEVPDLRPVALEAHRNAVADVENRARQLPSAGLAAADEVTLRCVLETCRAQIAEVDAGLGRFTVSAFTGLGLLIYIAAETALATPEAAADYLLRVERMSGYLEQVAARLSAGAAAGLLPVRSLHEVVLRQIDGFLDAAENPLTSVAPPGGWDGAAAWQGRLDALGARRLRPAVQRFRDVVAALPTRADEQCGLLHLPGGAAIYARLVRSHTTLPLDPQDIHELGTRLVAELAADITELGRSLGMADYSAIVAAVGSSAADTDTTTAMAAAAAAIRRAEAALPGWFSPPPPPPCEVLPMSDHLAAAGMPPHYTAPSLDGRRRGTYRFNALRAADGAGWDLEVTAFHEGVPGHHLQVSRMLGLRELPNLQSQMMVTAFEEGWALYTELLAEEMGLYSSPEHRLGALSMSMMRAARLVVDTGLHALGWSRDQALDYFRTYVPVSESVVVGEINRYIAMPGQALAYVIGQREILRLREEATARLGNRFDIRGFHAAVLDHGAVPLPAVATAVEAWIRAAGSGEPRGPQQ